MIRYTWAMMAGSSLGSMAICLQPFKSPIDMYMQVENELVAS